MFCFGTINVLKLHSKWWNKILVFRFLFFKIVEFNMCWAMFLLPSVGSSWRVAYWAEGEGEGGFLFAQKSLGGLIQWQQSGFARQGQLVHRLQVTPHCTQRLPIAPWAVLHHAKIQSKPGVNTLFTLWLLSTSPLVSLVFPKFFPVRY